MKQGITDLLGGEHADHLPREMTFDMDDSVVIRAATLNEMNKCHSKADNGGKYANNPFDYSETAFEYESRKTAQIATVKTLMQKNDVIFLQEADWNLYQNPKHVDATMVKAFKTVKDSYDKLLAQEGWAKIETQKGDNCKALVLLYNTNKLTPNGHKQGVLPVNGKNTAFEVGFTHNSSKKEVRLTNFHLDYQHDYQKDILAYLTGNAGVRTIMGGDANHTLKNDLPYLLSDYSHPSNLDSPNKDGQNLTTKHEGTNLNKAYDGFMTVGPKKVRIQEHDGKEFHVDAHNTVSTKNYKATQVVHETQGPGQPWQKRKLQAKNQGAAPTVVAVQHAQVLPVVNVQPGKNVLLAKVAPKTQTVALTCMEDLTGALSLTVGFEDMAKRDAFAQQMNVQGFTLQKHQQKPLLIVPASSGAGSIGVYTSRNGELSVNCGNNQARDKFCEALGITNDHAKLHTDPALNKAIYFDPKQLPPKEKVSLTTQAPIPKTLQIGTQNSQSQLLGF